MRKWAAILLLLTSLPVFAQQQSPRVGRMPSLPIKALADTLLQRYSIRLYYRPEWVADLRSPAITDTLTLEQYLDSTFRRNGFNYLVSGSRQVFLFDGANPASPAAVTRNPAISAPAGRFGQMSYVRERTRVTVGIAGNQGNREMFLTGLVTNQSNGEPVIGAALVLTETGWGTTTDGTGSYILAVGPGTHTLDVTCLGMETRRFTLEVLGSGKLNIEMESKLIDVKEVVIRSDKFHNIRGLQMGFQSVGVQEIKNIPMVLGERDVFRIATLMPGVQTVGEGTAGYNVRGSAADQNLFLINEVPVLNTSHLFGFFPAFNPDMISGFNLYKSNFPVEYGGRLASVFDLATRKGNKKQFGARGSISPVTASLLLETPVVRDRLSLLVSGRSTYSDWILDMLEDARQYERQGSFHDLSASLHLMTKNNQSLQLFGYYSQDRFSLTDEQQYRYRNSGTSLIYDRHLGNRWTLKTAAVLSRYDNYQANRVQPSKGYEHEFHVGSGELKALITGYPMARHRMGFGGGTILHLLNHGTVSPLGAESLLIPIPFGQESGLESALHLFDEFTVTDRITLYTGLRYSHFAYLKGANEESVSYSGPEYRVALNAGLDDELSLKLSYNKTRQYLFMLSNTIAIAPTDRWKLVDPSILPPVADQVSLGIYKNFTPASVESSLEVYYKKGTHSIDYRDGADLSFDPDIPGMILQGSQESYGAELLVRKNAGRLTGWISYAWSRSFLTVAGSDPSRSINLGLPYPASYDKPHAFNLVANYKISRRISVSSNVVYSSGRPVTYPTGYYYVNGVAVVNYSLRNEYRIPDYFRIDLAINLEGNLLKNKPAHGSWSLSVYNLTGRNNAYSVYFSNVGDHVKGYMLSIYAVPVFTVSYSFKLGNYATE